MNEDIRYGGPKLIKCPKCGYEYISCTYIDPCPKCEKGFIYPVDTDITKVEQMVKEDMDECSNNNWIEKVFNL